MATDVARAESRILPIVTVIGLVALLHVLPNRYTLLPSWIGYVLGVVLSASLLAAGCYAGTYWPRVERWAVALFVAVGSVTELVVMKDLIVDIVFHRKQLSAITLLATAVAIWVVNVLVFTFIYWQMDRGGPQGRALVGTAERTCHSRVGTSTTTCPTTGDRPSPITCSSASTPRRRSARPTRCRSPYAQRC